MNKSMLFAVLAVTLTSCAQAPTPGQIAAAAAEADSMHMTTTVKPHATAPDQQIAPAGTLSASANHDQQVDHAIDTLLGDHVAYHKAMTGFQQAVASRNASAAAALVRYPISVDIGGGQKLKIEDADRFSEYYNQFMTPAIANAITGTSYDSVAMNDQGISLGNGVAMLQGICDVSPCKSQDVKIASIQSVPGTSQ